MRNAAPPYARQGRGPAKASGALNSGAAGWAAGPLWPLGRLGRWAAVPLGRLSRWAAWAAGPLGPLGRLGRWAPGPLGRWGRWVAWSGPPGRLGRRTLENA